MSHHRRPLLVYVLAILLVLGHSFQILHQGSKVSDEHSEEDVQRYIKEQYAEMQLKKQKEGKKGGKKGATSSPESTKSDLKKPPEGITPSKLGLKRPINSTVEITNQVKIPNGVFWFGSQLESTDKAPMQRYADGSGPRKKILIK